MVFSVAMMSCIKSGALSGLLQEALAQEKILAAFVIAKLKAFVKLGKIACLALLLFFWYQPVFLEIQRVSRPKALPSSDLLRSVAPPLPNTTTSFALPVME